MIHCDLLYCCPSVEQGSGISKVCNSNNPATLHNTVQGKAPKECESHAMAVPHTAKQMATTKIDMSNPDPETAKLM